jgi:predicted permease
MNWHLLISAITPVLFVLGLGFAAGKHHSFTPEQTQGFSRLALQYALPATLFIGMAHLDRLLLLQQGPIAVVMLIGYSGLFLIAYWILRAKRVEKLKATLFSYAVSSTAVPIYGLTVLVPLYGRQVASGVVGMAALITNLTQVSVAVFLLEAARPKLGTSPSAWRTIARSAENPLVWAPLIGTIFVLLGWHLPPLFSAGLEPLAVSASGVAIFASGLTLAAYPMKLTSFSVMFSVLVCIAFKPAMFFGMLRGGHVVGTLASGAFVASAMPTSTPSVLFAQQYGEYESEMAGIMLLTTVGMLVVVPACMALSSFL